MTDRLSLRAVAHEVGVHLATVWRWTLSGVRGRRLRAIRVGGRRYVLRRDLEAFLEPDDSVTASVPPTPDRAAAAGKKLDSLL